MSNKSDEIKRWLHSVDTSDNEPNDEVEPCPSVIESSILETSSSSESGEEVTLGVRSNECNEYGNSNDLPSTMLVFNNVNISNSTNVHLGNIYNVNGTLNINVINSEEHTQSYNNEEQALNKSPVVRPACLIFPRYRWLAMDPLSEPNKVPEPVEYIVIGYTATTSSTVQARNIGIIRDFQTLNVESEGYNDIIYNFLIGCDGIVYEGRGWGIEGNHTEDYNHRSIGVAFVGNFKRELPTERALKVCRNLITLGVTEGHLSKDYKIFTTLLQLPNSTYNVLHEELKKWDNFYDESIFKNKTFANNCSLVQTD